MIVTLQNLKRRDHLEDLGVDGRIIKLELILGSGFKFEERYIA
jgi:hypothetical protein